MCVLFCHSPYSIITTGTLKQPLLGFIAVSAIQSQKTVVRVSLSVLTREEASFCRSLILRNWELGAPLPIQAPFPWSLCCSWWLTYVLEHREEPSHPLWRDHTKKLPDSFGKQKLTQGEPFQERNSEICFMQMKLQGEMISLTTW